MVQPTVTTKIIHHLFLLILITSSYCSPSSARRASHRHCNEHHRRNDEEEMTNYIPGNCGIHEKKTILRTMNGTDDEMMTDKIGGGFIIHSTEEYPSYARIKIYNDDKIAFCGGTIISPHHILTSAQCLAKKTRSGDLKRVDGIFIATGTIYNEPSSENRASRVCVPANYTGADPPVSDIAIIRLAYKLDITSYQQHACLPDEDLKMLEYVQAVGMGVQEKYKPSNMLRYVSARKSVCPDIYNYFDTLCLVTNKINGVGGSVCEGDSGGPLLVERSGRHYVAGIISYGGADCNNWPNNPIRASNVFALRKTITTLLRACD